MGEHWDERPSHSFKTVEGGEARRSDSSEEGRVLSTVAIEAPDQHGTAMAIEPGLNAVANMGRSVNPSILIMGNTDFLSLGVPDKVRATLQGLHLADHRRGGRLPGAESHTLLFAQCSRHDPHPKIFL